MRDSSTVYFLLSKVCFIRCSYVGDLIEFVTSLDTKEGVTADPDFFIPVIAIADKICALCALVEAPATE
jgi:hypothetical protein